MIKAVLFDMDGLMFDTETLSIKVFQEVARRQGFEMPLEDILKVIGFKKEAIYDFYREYYEDREDLDSDKLVDDYHDRMKEILFSKGPDKKPYLDECLEELKNSSYKIAVASSSGMDQIKNNLDKHNLGGMIDVLASGQEVLKGKPEPDVFLLAAKRLGVEPSECLVLEDSKYGVMAAEKADMKVVMIPDVYQPETYIKEKTHAVVETLKEIPTIIKDINSR